MNTARRLAILVLLVSIGPAPAGAQVTVSGDATATIGECGGEVEAGVTIR